MRCDVALLAHALLDGVEESELFPRLSEREAMALARVARPEMRRRRAAGRLAAKHLLLRGDDESVGAPLVALDGARLLAFPAERYREVELMPVGGDAAPRPTRGGGPLRARLSIAHAGGLSCAALAGGDAAIGVDLETVAPRAGAFYRGNFTAAEQAWVAGAADESALPADWLYTFLWTVKEAALKSGAAGVRSVWEFPAVALEPPPGLAALLATSVGAELGERFAACDLVVATANLRTRGRVETTATSATILTTFCAATSAPTAVPTALEATP